MLVVGTLRAFRRTAGVRRAQREALLLVGSPHPDGFTIVDHPVPVAYCLPGRDSTVVLSSSALALLSDQERALVLGHERRHLSARHHLALAYADALARTFRWVPLFARAREEVAVLLEMTADDAASSPSDRRALARALVTLAAGARVEATLAASDTAALQRVRRLVAPAVPRRRGVGVATASVAFVALSAPVALALAPAIEAITSECCTPAALPVRV
jgi:Zn-dependent protease with chaperone function